MPPPKRRPTTVALIALPESSAAALYGLYELLGSVGVAWETMTGEKADGPGFEVRIVGGEGGVTHGHNGIPIVQHASLAGATRPDIAIVPEIYISPDDDPKGRWPRETRRLVAWYRQGSTICSVCTGAVVLAESGLLDGHEATCHWGATDIFARHYPKVALRPERVLCQAGPDQRLVTGGGATSWEELALYLVARHCGQADAIRTAKLFVLGDRSEGQLLYAAMTRPRRHQDAIVAAAQDWIAENYAVANPVGAMVASSGLPERTFKRRFRAATGYAPIDYVQTLRIEEAKQLLETTGLATDAVGRDIGYEDPAFFRRLFRRRTGVTPARYRQKLAALPLTPPDAAS